VARLLEQGELRTSLIISVTTAGVFSSLLDSGQPWRPPPIQKMWSATWAPVRQARTRQAMRHDPAAIHTACSSKSSDAGGRLQDKIVWV
jgi:hypothetical protein